MPNPALSWRFVATCRPWPSSSSSVLRLFLPSLKDSGGLERPAVLLEVIQFVHRYLFLLAEQTQRMATAARARGARRSFAAVAGSVGVLFARSYDRAEAIHRSMLARGYTGSLPSRERLRFGAADLCLVLFACVDR